ncbi:MAG: hypothetical protein KGM16_11200 [Bacteroidota bacterium]|nr:hypothetical protein [Bacteroidota bacterium]
MYNSTNDLEFTDENQSIPRISLILPYEMKMKKKEALLKLLENRADMVEKELLAKFPAEKVALVLKKFRKIIKTVNCPVKEKNIAIFISPVAEKVYYFSPSYLEKYRVPVLVK